MDQDNSKGQDKRNWRERLGIGAQGGKELPKISDDFRKEAPPVAARPVASAARPAPRPAVAGVKPAPMAPRAPTPMVSRANPKVISPSAPVSPEKLAERLRSQREASTKLAEQRVQVAKQRAEAQQAPAAFAPVPQAAPPVSGAKPKFTFAEETPAAKPAAPVQARPTVPVPPPVAPQLAPPRPPLGAQQAPNGFTQRPAPPAYQPPPAPNYQPSGFGNQPFQPNYSQQPVPPYRPIDPNTGYAPQPGYAPPPQQRGFGVPPQQSGFTPPTGGPRLNVPQRTSTGLNPNFAPPPAGFNAGPRLSPTPQRAPLPPVGQENEYEDEYYDEPPAPRGARPTSNDYQQAYREAEYGYEDEAPRSKAPWILAGIVLATMLMAGLGVWLYQSSIKPLMTGQGSTQEVPAVAAPENPAKVQAEQPDAAQQQPAVATPTKKQIYDRIVGDQEILGGDVAPPAEVPAAIPEPTTNEAAPPQPSGGAGEDAAPLPIPPPPGGAGDQQGSLEPNSEKQSVENITPAAGESLAAVAAPGDVEGDPVATASAAAPPAPGEITPPASSTAAEEIVDAAPVVVEKKKPVVAVKKKIEAAKPKQVAEKSLGSKPVVLVAPSKKVKVATSKPIADNDAIGSEVAANDGGIYSGEGIATPEQNVPVVTASQPKKKKTLADLFKGEDAGPAEQQIADVAPPVAAKPIVAAKPKVVEAPAQVASGAGGFVVQLASFRSKAEATTEFSRLKAKHSGTLGRFSPIISEATVGGATRYRLSVGSMESQAQANAVCSSLFAGGERDCLVKRR